MADRLTRKEEKMFSEEVIREKRSFPVLNTVFLVICVIVQAAFIIFAFNVSPTPQDAIREYAVTVEPRDDGTLDIEYSFVWTALDETEDLTWVEIGMANKHFTFYNDSFSENIKAAEKYVDGDYVSARIDFDRAYVGGETLEFSFKVNQREMLCVGNFYEFIPGWFNATPVEHYTFRWKNSDTITSANAQSSDADYYVWEGRMDLGTYVSMRVGYGGGAFANAAKIEHEEFDSSGVFNDLEDTKTACIVTAIVVVLLIAIAEVYIIDSYVSYVRGRGFITEYGHRVHHYGRINPRYRKERERRHAPLRGGGGGCACACACACAGGGRAGCSQKDTYDNTRSEI